MRINLGFQDIIIIVAENVKDQLILSLDMN